MSENQPHIAQRSPYKVKIEAGKTYFWCRCGLSDRQPFCDGKHRQEALFEPLKWVADKDGEVFLCGCKHTSNEPFCDGTHKNLP